MTKGLKVDMEKLFVHYLRGVSVGWVKVVMVETERSYMLQPLRVLAKTQA